MWLRFSSRTPSMSKQSRSKFDYKVNEESKLEI